VNRFFDQFVEPSKSVLDVYMAELSVAPLDTICRHDPARWRRYEEAMNRIESFFQSDGKVHFIRSEEEGFRTAMHEIYRNEIYPSGKNHVLTLSNEGSSIVCELDRYKTMGLHIEELPVNEKGHLDRAVLEAALTPRTSLLCLSWANPLTGVIQPLWEIANICKNRGVLLYVQASEVVGKIYFRGDEIPIDFLAVDGRAIGSLSGTGVLITEMKLPELNCSAGVVAFATALEELDDKMDTTLMESARLRSEFEKGVEPIAKIHFAESDRLPNVSCISIPGIHADLLLNRLYSKGYAANLGGNRWQKLEHIVDASAVSFRFGEESVDDLVASLKLEAEKLCL